MASETPARSAGPRIALERLVHGEQVQPEGRLEPRGDVPKVGIQGGEEVLPHREERPVAIISGGGGHVAAAETPAEKAARVAEAGLRAKHDVTIGSKVRVELKAPLFDGTVGAVADQVQTFDSAHTSGQWQWQIKPNTPGQFKLPLKLTIYDSAGEEALTEKAILNVHVHVPMTATYIALAIWNGIAIFFSSLQGVLTSVAGVGAATAGLRAWAVRRSQKGAKSPAPALAATAGYL